jgi:hypothetical protein
VYACSCDLTCELNETPQVGSQTRRQSAEGALIATRASSSPDRRFTTAQFADCLIGARYRALARSATATFDAGAFKLP